MSPKPVCRLHYTINCLLLRHLAISTNNNNCWLPQQMHLTRVTKIAVHRLTLHTCHRRESAADRGVAPTASSTSPMAHLS